MTIANLTNFIGFNTSQELHLRTYVHRTGFQAFGKTEEEAIPQAVRDAKQILVNSDDVFFPSKQIGFIAAVWGRGDFEMVDFFKITYGEKWSDNPISKAYVFKNGVYQPNWEDDTCGDGLIMLGREEEHRRKTLSPRDYFSSPSPLGIPITR